MSRRYVIQQYGPGFCRNGHDRAVYGTHHTGECVECRRKAAQRKHLRRKDRLRWREGNVVDVPLGW